MKKPLKWSKFFGVVLVASLEVGGISASTSGCSGAQNHDAAQTALTGAQILCVLATNLTNDADVAKACGIAEDLIPIIRPFLVQKEKDATLARRAGRCAEAGAPDAGSDAK
jgi:hypothetical protein